MMQQVVGTGSPRAWWILLLGGVASAAACGNASSSSPPPSSASIGPEGGVVAVAGLTVTVPPNAVDHPVVIAVTADGVAPAGYAVDGATYRFSPSGLHFAVPLTVTFPTGAASESVFWTADGDESRVEPLATSLDAGTASAHPTHFSSGFVGAPAGVTCTVTLSIEQCAGAGACTCSTTVTTETDVRFAFAPSLPDPSDPYGALTTDSPGIAALYNNPLPRSRAPYFTGNAAHDLYLGEVAPPADFGTGHLSGRTLSFTLDASRGMEAPCLVPKHVVKCSGATTLDGPLPPPTDGGAPPMDASSDAPFDAGVDASDASDASDGGVCSSPKAVAGPAILGSAASPGIGGAVLVPATPTCPQADGLTFSLARQQLLVGFSGHVLGGHDSSAGFATGCDLATGIAAADVLFAGPSANVAGTVAGPGTFTAFTCTPPGGTINTVQFLAEDVPPPAGNTTCASPVTLAYNTKYAEPRVIDGMPRTYLFQVTAGVPASFLDVGSPDRAGGAFSLSLRTTCDDAGTQITDLAPTLYSTGTDSKPIGAYNLAPGTYYLVASGIANANRYTLLFR